VIPLWRYNTYIHILLHAYRSDRPFTQRVLCSTVYKICVLTWRLIEDITLTIGHRTCYSK